MNKAQANFSALMGQIDTFLLMTVSLALAVGIVGIINTMLMSTTERFVEFGVLRTNGWSQVNILSLVTLESAYLGLLSGFVGCVLAWLGVMIVNQFLSGGIHLAMSPVTLGSWRRPVGHHGNFGWTLSRLACCSAGAHGGHSLRVALIQLSVVNCPLSVVSCQLFASRTTHASRRILQRSAFGK